MLRPRKCEICHTVMEKVQTGKGHIMLLPEEILSGYGPAEECQNCGAMYCDRCYPSRPNICSKCSMKRLKLVKVFFPFGYLPLKMRIAEITKSRYQISDSDRGWAYMVRQYLAHKDLQSINQAINKLKSNSDAPKNHYQTFFQHLLSKFISQDKIDSEILMILNALKNGDIQKIFYISPILVKKLHLTGKKEEEVTISLLHDEFLIQRAEGYLMLSGSSRVQAFKVGIDTCISCIKAAQELDDKPLTASYLRRLAHGLYSAGKLKESIEAFNEALSIWRILAEEQPIKYLTEVADTLYHMGNVWDECNELTKARVAFSESLTIFRELIHVNPEKNRLGLARVLNGLGNYYRATNNYIYAVEMFEESLSIFEDIDSSESSNTELDLISNFNRLRFLENRSGILRNYGYLLISQNRSLPNIKKAQDAFKKAALILEELLRISHLLGSIELAHCKTGLGMSFLMLGRNQDLDGSQEKSKEFYEAARIELEAALEIYRQHNFGQISMENPYIVEALVHLGETLGKLQETSKARKLLIEAVEICKRNKMWLKLAIAFETRRMIEMLDSGNPMAGFRFAEQSVEALETMLSQLDPVERMNRSKYKKYIEVSYCLCIAHYAKQDKKERVFHLLESLRRVDRLSDLSADYSASTKALNLDKAKKIVNQFNIAYFAIHTVPGGVVFFTLQPSGRVEITTIEKGWSSKFFELFEFINQTLKDLSFEDELKPENLYNELNARLPVLYKFGRELFDMLPEEVQVFLKSETKYIFISPYAEMQNLPFEFLYLPIRESNREWLGLKKLLPRVHNFSELHSVLLRQPDQSSRGGIVIGDPQDNLPFAKETATLIANKLQNYGFELVPDGGPILGKSATNWKFLDGFNTGIVFGFYAGHGGFDNFGAFLGIEEVERLRPSSLASLSLDSNPIIYYDCCSSGIEHYNWGGEYKGLGYITISIGASCCLQSNRFLIDKLASNMAKLFTHYLLEEGKTTGEALFTARNQIAKANSNPFYWGYPFLFGNPDAKLIIKHKGGK